LNPTAIFSKTGKGVQEASGKTSDLSRADRAVLKEIDGKTALANIAAKFEKIPADKFYALIQQFEKDGYIREVSSGVTAPQAPPARSAPAPRAAPPPASSDGDDEMDFTQAIKLPPKAAPAAPKPPPVDLAAASRADAERKAKEQQTFDYKARQEAELKAKAQADAKAKAEAEARARATAEAKTKALAEAEAKVKAAREAAIRMATEVKAKAEAEGKAKADAAEGREREALEKARRESEDKARLEAELTGKLEAERRAREDAERRAREAADQTRKEMEEKAKRDADELRQRLETEMKAKLEEERKAREAEDRKRREEDDRKRAEEDRKRREEDDRRRKEEEARRAKEEAERKVREEEDRRRREEEDRKRREEDDRRRKEDEERRAKEAAERLARKEQEERRAKEEVDRRKQDEERRAKEEADRRAKEEAERRAREEQDSKRRKEEDERRKRDEAERNAKEEAEAKARAAQSASTSVPSIQPTVAPPPPPPAAIGGIDDALLADLDSFGKREEEEQKAREEAERKTKEEAARKAKAEAERKAKEAAEAKRREEEEQRRAEEEQRKAKEDAEQRVREDEERQKQEEDERKRKARESLAAKEAERKAAQGAAAAKAAKPAGKSAAKDDDDIGVTDDDLDMDDVKKDEKALSATARKAAREREQAPVAAAAVRRPKKWGKPAAIALFVLLAGGVGVLQLMPVSTAEYEKAASEAMGVPVKIGSARLSVITGIEARFEGVSIGETVKIRTVRGYPEVGSLFGGKKSFSRIELEGVSLSQSQLADAVLGKVSGENFRVARIMIKQAKLDGPLALPALDVDAVVSGDGSLQSISLRGGDKLSVQLSPKGSDIGFEISAGSLALPFAPALNLSDFSMKGTANRGGVTNSEFDGRAFDGVITGSAKIRWGANWLVEGEVRARGVRVAVIAPALISEGKVDGRGAYTMSGPNPATLFESARIQGEFKIDKGVLGSFDLRRALQTGGAQTSGRTPFTELTGQAVYDRGAVKVSNVAIAEGGMNAGASLEVDANGGLSGRIVADVKTPNQTLRATLNISGKLQDPVIRK
jgi:hypothetical protein